MLGAHPREPTAPTPFPLTPAHPMWSYHTDLLEGEEKQPEIPLPVPQSHKIFMEWCFLTPATQGQCLPAPACCRQRPSHGIHPLGRGASAAGAGLCPVLFPPTRAKSPEAGGNASQRQSRAAGTRALTHTCASMQGCRLLGAEGSAQIHAIAPHSSVSGSRGLWRPWASFQKLSASHRALFPEPKDSGQTHSTVAH